jgi:hypothetical protein
VSQLLQMSGGLGRSVLAQRTFDVRIPRMRQVRPELGRSINVDSSRVVVKSELSASCPSGILSPSGDGFLIEAVVTADSHDPRPPPCPGKCPKLVQDRAPASR